MGGMEVLVKFLEIIFKTLAYLFIFTSILLMPLTLAVKVCMLVAVIVGVPLVEAWQKRRDNGNRT